nr:relaxase/mobilization nuclease domain-containing protein [uncultured Lachnoclostridium sp.]
MAIVKAINGAKSSHGAMRNVIEYVLREDKTDHNTLCYVSGPWDDSQKINYDSVYRSFLNEKKLWDKDSGRMYLHTVLSFHENEKISPEQVLEFGKAWAEKVYPDNQSLFAVHQDKGHLHCHIVTNSVSFIDGHKINVSRQDLQRGKGLCNRMCAERGLTVAEKGKHFDGSEIEQGEVRAWDKNKYKLLQNESKKGYVAECGMAVLQATEKSRDKESFISEMKSQGWKTIWTDSKKHITFMDEHGRKVRDSNLEKTFQIPATKEGLTHEFERQNEADRAESEELDQYYREVEEASGRAVESDEVLDGAEREFEEYSAEERSGETTDYIRKLRAEERAATEERRDREAERENRDAERVRQDLERSRAEAERTTTARKRPAKQREISPDIGWER